MGRNGFTCMFAAACLVFAAGCKKEVQPTTVEVKDPDRHYYPILQGQRLEIVFPVTNTGENPLVIKEIQASCGCIVVNRKSHIIVPGGGVENIHLTYNSTKNIGAVSHTVRIYGNILPRGRAEVKFDVNVVPDADYTRDYEKLYQDYNIKNGIVKRMVDGRESERGYYVGEP